ncbi:MAG: hypothetical protein MUF27_04100 [Acidobacteria bacterium]|nr:hypothetical protein [Acidobacteriota bacterium]
MLQAKIMRGEPSAHERWKATEAAGGAKPVELGPPGETAQNPVTYASAVYPRPALPADPARTAEKFGRY